jgi:hypothetical protein
MSYTVRIQLIEDSTNDVATQQVTFQDHRVAYAAAIECYDKLRSLAVNGKGVMSYEPRPNEIG